MGSTAKVVPNSYKLYKGAYNSAHLFSRLPAIRFCDKTLYQRYDLVTAIIDRPLQHQLQATKRQWRP